MQEKINQWNKLLILAGIKPLEVPLKKYSPEAMLIGMEWIERTFEINFAKLIQARALITEDQWAAYNMLYTEAEMDEFQEIIAWNRARYEVRIAIRARPAIFRKPNKKKKNHDTEQEADADVRPVTGSGSKRPKNQDAAEHS